MSVDVVILGGGGTVGRALFRYLQQTTDLNVHVWQRQVTPLYDFARLRSALTSLKPKIVYNLAIASAAEGQPTDLINTELPANLAAWSKEIGFRLVHTSSVLVFTDANKGPLYPDTRPDAVSGYGLEKRLAEEQVCASSGDFVVLRLGWQIAKDSHTNNMVAHLDRLAAEGTIYASRSWLPACSFVEKTAQMLWASRTLPSAIYNFSCNRGHSFFEIACELKARFGKSHWRIAPDDSYTSNQLMFDHRLPIPQLF